MRLFQLAFYAHDGSLETVLDMNPLSQLRYARVLNNFGAIEFTLPLSEAHACLTTLDTVCVPMYADGSGPMTLDGAYFLRYQQPFDVDGEDVLVVAGYSVASLLWRNIFIAEDDPLEANGFCTKSGDASTVMWEIINEQCVNPATNSARAIPNLALAADPQVGAFVAFREEDNDTKVIEHIKKLGRAGGVDFWVDYDPTGPTFTVNLGTVGSDRRKSVNYPTQPFLYFSPNLGNLDQPELTVDRREEQNFVYVFGQGPAGSNLRYGEAGVGLTDSPWNRLEFGVQARNTKTLDDWETAAADALKEQREQLTQFTFMPKFESPGAVYGVDWFLGDLVTTAYQNQEFEMRIASAETNIDPTLATTKPELTLL